MFVSFSTYLAFFHTHSKFILRTKSFGSSFQSLSTEWKSLFVFQQFFIWFVCVLPRHNLSYQLFIHFFFASFTLSAFVCFAVLWCQRTNKNLFPWILCVFYVQVKNWQWLIETDWLDLNLFTNVSVRAFSLHSFIAFFCVIFFSLKFFSLKLFFFIIN